MNIMTTFNDSIRPVKRHRLSSRKKLTLAERLKKASVKIDVSVLDLVRDSRK